LCEFSFLVSPIHLRAAQAIQFSLPGPQLFKDLQRNFQGSRSNGLEHNFRDRPIDGQA
jgi:hypothetical protein